MILQQIRDVLLLEGSLFQDHYSILYISRSTIHLKEEAKVSRSTNPGLVGHQDISAITLVIQSFSSTGWGNHMPMASSTLAAAHFTLIHSAVPSPDGAGDKVRDGGTK